MNRLGFFVGARRGPLGRHEETSRCEPVFALCSRSDVPRQQVVDAVDRMLGNAVEYLTQIRFRIDAVELRRSNQAVERGGMLPACIRSGKKIILASKGHGTQRSFGGIVVDLEAAVSAIACQCNPTR